MLTDTHVSRLPIVPRVFTSLQHLLEKVLVVFFLTKRIKSDLSYSLENIILLISLFEAPFHLSLVVLCGLLLYFTV